MPTPSRTAAALAAVAILLLPHLAAAQAAAPSAPGTAAPEVTTLPTVQVIGTAPLSGSGLDRDKVPGATDVLTRGDVVRTGTASALRALSERVGGVTLDEAQGNPFQPTLYYRGFEASPLVGNAQGLAVYVNGTRFNQPFGDTTNWDLIPDIAIDRIEVVGSNPAFGLNALGGAISVRLRDGFGFHGGEAELSGGSFGRIDGAIQYGAQSGNTAAYVAARGLNEDGWREHSPSQLLQFYGDVGWRGDKAELHLNITAADNLLTGNGTSPVELLAVNRAAVFTYPDQTRNKYGRVALDGTYDVSDALSLQASLYYTNLSQRTLNGNASDATPCAADATVLCNGDGAPYTSRGGVPIANTVQPGFLPGFAQYATGGPYSELDRTATDTNGAGASLQATYRHEILGRPNRVVAGVGYDGGRTTFTAVSLLGALSADRGYVGPGVAIDQADASLAPVRVDAANDYYGAYLSDVLDVTDALAVTASGRFNAAEIGLRDRNGTALDGNHGYTRFNPAIGATYKITPGITAYAGYAESNRAPTPAELSCASAASPCSLTNFFVADPSLKQVVGRTVEAGLRGAAALTDAMRLVWHAGLFRAANSDDILFTASDANGHGFFQNVGRTRRQGVESGVSVQSGPVSAFVEYTYTDATFRSPLTLSSANNPAADANGNIQVTPGDRLPGIPRHQVKLGVQYQATAAWSIGATAQASSGRVLQGDESNLNKPVPGFFVLNLNTRYKVTERVELFASVENATNAAYATFGAFSPTASVPIVQAPNAQNPRSLSPGAPVAGFGGVRVRF